MLALALAAVLAGSPPTLSVAPAEAGHAIDAVLDEAAWATAEVATGFVQFAPTEGVPASRRTEVRVLRAPDGLIVGARMTGVDIRTTLSRRDDAGDAERFVVGIDSYNDQRTAYLFGLTAAGVQFDYLLEGTDGDESWDAVWESAARVDAEGWTAEIRIPYSQLRYAEGVSSWGVNFQRESPARGEDEYWAPFTRASTQAGYAHLFGTLEGLSGISPRPILQVLPYSLAGGSRRESSVTAGDADYGLEGNVGADLKVGLSSNVTLDATLNPDFGQVEADPAQLNLSTFEVIFDERRPFFTEGTQIFDLTIGGSDGALLYTRRVGGSSPIIAATKLSGRTSRGLSFGALGAATGDDFSPTRGYVAARLKQEFAGQSYLGGGLTAFAADENGATPLSLAAAADWALRFADRDWLFEGTAAGTARTIGGTRDVGGATYVGLDKVQGYFLPGFGFRAYSSAFRLNDVGRFRQTNVLQLRGGARMLWNESRPVGPFRRVSSGGFGTQTWTLSDGANQGLSLFANTGVEFPGFQEFGVSVNASGIGGVDVRETRGLGPITNLARVSAEVEFESDSRRRLRWEVGASSGLEEGGGQRVGVEAGLSWTLSDRVGLDVSGGLSAADDERGWAANESVFLTPAGLAIGAFTGAPDAFGEDDLVAFDGAPGLLDGLPRYEAPLQVPGEAVYAPVFGARDTREVDLTTRAQVIFGPGISLQLYGQLFAARGRYSDFALLGGPDDLRPVDGYPKRRDFSLASFNANAVFRWEYRPGSALFVVWSEGRNDRLFEETLIRDAGRSPFDRGAVDTLGSAFDAFPDDVLLVKLTYLIMR